MANKSKPETIFLKGHQVQKEGQASAALSPGHLVERGGSKDFQVQSTEKGVCSPMFAVENDLIGNEITDAYAANDNVVVAYALPGAEINARVAASATAIVANDALEAAGDGTVRKFTDGVIIGYALEAINNSSNSSSEVFIKMEIK